MASTTLLGTSYVSATFVAAEPAATHVRHAFDSAHASAYFSTRSLTIGGLTLLFVGLCCLGASLLRFSRVESRPIQAVELEKPLVLDQNTINRSFPIRTYPSMQQRFLDSEEDIVVAVATPPEESCPTLNNTNNPVHENEKQTQQPSSQSAFINVTRIGRIWSRDSSHCPSGRGSPCPSQVVVRMPSFNTTTQQQQLDASETPDSTPVTLQTLNDPQGPSNELATEEMCSICLGEYVIDDQIRILPCSHEYHVMCIDTWLCHKSTFCPLCKRNLLNDISSSTPVQVMEVPAS
ncbi:hypothetical protein B0O80DRAFT_493398 [Mortierella sp. GBAus27b]|nr:hypothetical protein B0O80DRAFT_493398 [Mortierella sp. GBAus27b]